MNSEPRIKKKKKKEKNIDVSTKDSYFVYSSDFIIISYSSIIVYG